VQDDAICARRDRLTDAERKVRDIELAVVQRHLPAHSFAGFFGRVRGDRRAFADLSGRDDPNLLAGLRLLRLLRRLSVSAFVTAIDLGLRLGEHRRIYGRHRLFFLRLLSLWLRRLLGHGCCSCRLRLAATGSERE
jgi:hypothetical protein